MRSIGGVVAALLVAGFLGCSSDPYDGGSSVTEMLARARLRQIEMEIDALIGTPGCSDSTECRVIAFGAKPCGGPWRYKIYSTATTDTARIAAAVANYYDVNREYNRKYGWVSDCAMAPMPKVRCIDGRCQSYR